MARLLLPLFLILALSLPPFSSALPGDHSSRFGKRPTPAPVVEQPRVRGNLVGRVSGLLRGAVGVAIGGTVGVVGHAVGGAVGVVGHGIKGLSRGGQLLRPAVLVSSRSLPAIFCSQPPEEVFASCKISRKCTIFSKPTPISWQILIENL